MQKFITFIQVIIKNATLLSRKLIKIKFAKIILIILILSFESPSSILTLED